MHILYNVLMTVLLPFALLRLLWRSRQNSAYRKRPGERLALTGMPTKHPIWIHTVSVGEFLATLPLIEQLLVQGESLLITTTTPTGSAMVGDKLGTRVAHRYLPFDAPFLAKRFIHQTQPRIAIFVETEIWPNYLQQLKKQGTPALLINARLSEKSFLGYRRLGRFARHTIGNFTEVACQNEASCQRFQRLGANATLHGNLKFDLRVPDDLSNRQADIQQRLGQRDFILAASTHAGEESLLLNAYQESQESRLLVIAPRHPERSEAVRALAEALALTPACFSKTTSLPADCQVLIIDKLGVLLAFYSLADYAIIGGSFVPRGGHNPLEAALFATPCVIGVHHFNFDSVITAMQATAAIEVMAAKDLFITAPSKAIGENARRFLQSNQGATKKYLALIVQHLKTNPT